MMSMASTSFVCASCLLFSTRYASAFTIDSMKHDIQQITEKNFDGVIGKFRADSVSALWFFKDDDSADKKFLDVYNEVAKDLKLQAKITAINCNQWAKFCTKNNVKLSGTPAIMMYPTFPAPAFLWEGKMEAKAIAGKLAKMIPDMSTKLTKDNVDSWLSGEVSKPKLIIFSNKKNAPTILKALSSDSVFKRTAKFGFVTESETEVCEQFKVTKFPAAILHRLVGKNVKKETFSGQMNFEELYNWINPYVESGMGDKLKGAGGGQEASIEDDQPWLAQDVPEMTAKSSNHICFKGDGLCVIYLKDGVAEKSEVDMLAGLSKKYASQNNKATMKFMWIDLAIETAFKTLFQAGELPSVVIFNPHKRLRFTNLEHGDGKKGDTAGITALIDKVLGGDARFTNVPGQKLPAWATREAPKKEGKKEL